MPRRLAPLFAFLALALPLRAADPPAEPAVVVRLQSVEGLLGSFRYLAAQADREEEAKQVEALVKARSGPRGVEGIDIAKPLGFYAVVRNALPESTAVFLLPVADQDAFLGLLGNFNLEPKKEGDGVFSVTPPQYGKPVFFRFADGYAHVSPLSKDSLAPDRLLKPERALGAAGGVLDVRLWADRIPSGIRQIGMGLLELQLASAKAKKEPKETEAQHALKGKAIDALLRGLTAVMQESGELRLRFDVDQKAHELVAEVSLAGKPGTSLAATFAEWGGAASTLGGLVTSDAASNLLGRVALPEELRRALAPVVDEAFRDLLAKETDPTKRRHGEVAAKAIVPTLKSGELDSALSLRGPGTDQRYTLVGGLKVTEGATIEAAVKELLKDLPESERSKIQTDADSAGGVKIHRLDPAQGLDAGGRHLFGEGPAYLAIRSDAVLFAIGPDALRALKEAIEAKPKGSPVLVAEASLARVAQALSREQKAAPEAAKKAFAGAKDSDRIRVRVEGGSALRATFVMKSAAIRFFSLLDGQRE